VLDICDYYDNLDSGYGKGIYKKESAVALPHHSHCHCRYHAHYDKVKKTSVKNPAKETLKRFNVHDRRAILGSHDKLRRFYDGESVEDIFNSSRPKYPINSYGEVLGYNGGMETFYQKFNKNNLGYKIGTISSVLAKILLSDTRDVIISSDTIKKI